MRYYSLIQFNSKNVLGNQSSDIINSSMITYLMNAINGTEMFVDAEGKLSPEALIQYGNEKFRVNSKEKIFERTSFGQKLVDIISK